MREISRRRAAAQPSPHSPFDRHSVNEEKRLAIIRAAGLAFKRSGFHNTSLDDVASVLGVTKPTIYYYAKGKQDLLFQCHQHALDLGDEAMALDEPESPALKSLERVLSYYIEQITEDFYSYSLLSDLNDLEEMQRKEILHRRRKFDSFCRNLIKRGVEDGSMRCCDPMLTTFWIMGAINAIPKWFDPKGKLNGRMVAEDYMTFISQGLRNR